MSKQSNSTLTPYRFFIDLTKGAEVHHLCPVSTKEVDGTTCEQQYIYQISRYGDRGYELQAPVIALALSAPQFDHNYEKNSSGGHVELGLGECVHPLS
jgi:hypothetical protein